jgi:hypothetical protein
MHVRARTPRVANWSWFRVITALNFWASVWLFVQGRHEIDVSWDFERSLEGWANATSEEMEMQVHVENGELRSHIVGPNPHMDSPNLFVQTSTRHYVVMRMMYMGPSTTGNLLLRTGAGPSKSFQLDQTTTNWNDVAPIKAIQGSGAISAAHSIEMLADNNPYTYYASASSAGAYVVFDLQQFRWISSFSILPFGNTTSPKRCLLQKSGSTGMGPFITVASFTVPLYGMGKGSSEPFVVANFGEYARYWRLYVLDNYGGSGIAIRDISIAGYDETVTAVPFTLDNSGKYSMYYLPIYQYILGPLIRMRLELKPPVEHGTTSLTKASKSRAYREAMSSDFISIARAPDIWRVRGCLNKYYNERGFSNPMYNVTSQHIMINEQLAIRFFSQNEMTSQFASTYDCPTEGGVSITIEGLNFGSSALVYIGGSECPVTSYGVGAEGGRVDMITCTLPQGAPGMQSVLVKNGVFPGLFQEAPSISYRTAPPVPLAPIVTNIAAYKVDLVWSPPGTEFDNLITTGYRIMWFQPKHRDQVSNLTVGNVTTTSVRGLTPGTEYIFAIAAISEGAVKEQSAILPTDLYGRREPTAGAMIGTFSTFTNVTGTLTNDFDFSFFNANATLNASSIFVGSNGPTGYWGSEGHYGLVLVGSANIENCNVSSTCCDGYNATIGLASCGTKPSVCAVLPARMLEYDYVVDGITRRQTPQNIPYLDGGLPEINIFTLSELVANKGADLPSASCGPALRLTDSEARASGAAWYRRKMNVREGFDTTITFQLSNPSFRCTRMNDVNTYCRSRGADGLAFVMQNVANNALGLAGSGLGYEGIFNSLAVEIDTYMNYDNMDFYENHISVMTQVLFAMLPY